MTSEELLILWNNRFPLDRSYRKKHNIAFGSSKHREVNQIDVYLDALEDKVYEKHIELHRIEKEGLEMYKKTGEWLKESTLGDKEFDELFDKLDVSKFSDKKEET